MAHLGHSDVASQSAALLIAGSLGGSDKGFEGLEGSRHLSNLAGVGKCPEYGEFLGEFLDVVRRTYAEHEHRRCTATCVVAVALDNRHSSERPCSIQPVRFPDEALCNLARGRSSMSWLQQR